MGRRAGGEEHSALERQRRLCRRLLPPCYPNHLRPPPMHHVVSQNLPHKLLPLLAQAPWFCPRCCALHGCAPDGDTSPEAQRWREGPAPRFGRNSGGEAAWRLARRLGSVEYT